MAQFGMKITPVSSISGTQPKWFSEAVVLLTFLKKWDVLDEAFDILRMNRRGGYTEADLLAWFTAYFCSVPGCGIKAFAKEARETGEDLMKVAERERFPTQSAISRPWQQSNCRRHRSLCVSCCCSCRWSSRLTGIGWSFRCVVTNAVPKDWSARRRSFCEES